MVCVVRGLRFVLAIFALALLAPTAAAVPIQGQIQWVSRAEIQGVLGTAPDWPASITMRTTPNSLDRDGTWTFEGRDVTVFYASREERNNHALKINLDQGQNTPTWKNETKEFSEASVALRLTAPENQRGLALITGGQERSVFQLDPEQRAFQIRTVNAGQSLITIPGSAESSKAFKESPYRSRLSDRTFEVEGRFDVAGQGKLQAVVYGWTLSVLLPDGRSETYQTGMTTLTDPLTGLPDGYKISYAILSSKLGSFHIGPLLTVKAFTPLLRYDGVGAFPMGRYVGESEEFAARTSAGLRLPGTVWMGVTSQSTADHEARIWGQADWEAPVAPWFSEGGGAGVSLALAAAAVGTAAAAWLLGPRLVRWTCVGAVGLFARLKEQRLEDNPTRHKIFGLIASNPGLTLSDIVAQLDIGWGTAAYHTQVLQRQHRVRNVRFLNRVCFFSFAETSADRQLQTVLLRQRNYEEVMRTLQGFPGLSQREIAEKTRHARQYISRLVGKMERAGLLRSEPYPTGRRYFPMPAALTSPSDGDPGALANGSPGGSPLSNGGGPVSPAPSSIGAVMGSANPPVQ